MRRRQRTDPPVFLSLRRFRKYFFSGIATIFPVLLTIYTFVFVFRIVDNLAGKYINAFLFHEYGFKIPGLGFIISLAIIFIVGFFANNFFGRKLLPWFEKLFLKIPFVSHIYPPAKQLSDFLFGDTNRAKFKKVVLVQYPEPKSWALGFITNENLDEFNQKTGDELIAVLIPTSPSPFSGPVICVPKSKVKVLDMSVDQAIKFLVSGGIVMT
jgi:uncharacterized membrane protein